VGVAARRRRRRRGAARRPSLPVRAVLLRRLAVPDRARAGTAGRCRACTGARNRRACDATLGLGTPGGPPVTDRAGGPEPQAAAEPELPGPDEPVSFAAHIRPLFRDGTGSR